MKSDIRYIAVDRDGQKRLRKEFDDDRIVYGLNQKMKQNQVWYKPTNSPPYMVCFAKNAAHAIQQMAVRVRADKMRAVDLLREIDDHNEKIVASQQTDAVDEARSQLKAVATGRQYFLATG